ncbi:flavodoxin family protein [Petroclostridium sp. X23]|uniref:flavodoxin family protein n=1 Tax=Petroclostridium sp. X23 TaxID=3045146 RepID=UPI0024AD5DA0|nr:flavodoxin family protein [Petroclostridium sp. X23]WHH60487.1 flavodoxin family protein [Petroclostridium sp. X23]
MKKIKLLAISASPRKGNSQYLLEKALECVSELPFPVEVQTYSMRGKKIGPCIGCLKCYENGGQCILKDDFNELREMWIKADGIIYSSPVYVVGIPGQLKCFYDRLHNSFYGYYEVTSMRHMKAIGFITQGACIYGGQELAMQSIILHATLINSVPVAPDGSHIGSGGWTGGRFDVEASKDRAVEQTPDASITIDTARSMVKRVVETAAILKSGVSALSNVLEKDPRYVPFIKRMNEEEA